MLFVGVEVGRRVYFFVDLRDAIEEWCAGFVGVFGKV